MLGRRMERKTNVSRSVPVGLLNEAGALQVVSRNFGVQYKATPHCVTL